MASTKSKSTRLGSTSKRRVKKFRRIRRQFIDVRETQAEDLKFAWAAYRKGALEELNPIFGSDMGLEDFKIALPELLLSYGNTLWTLVAPVPGREAMPVGMVTGFVKGRVIHDTHFVWFPWASPRVKLETAKEFLERSRKEFFVMGYPSEDFEKFFDALVDMGTLKRGCRFHGLLPGKAVIFYYAKI